MFPAGENKFRLDPFQPLKEQDIAWVKNIIGEVHGNFIDLVKLRRPKVDVNHKTVFTGDVFTGTQAAKIGLIDGLQSDLEALMQKRYGDEIKVERMAAPLPFPFSMFMKPKAEVSINTEEIIDTLYDKGVNSRFGIR